MAFRNYIMTTILLLCLAALVMGCSESSTISTTAPTTTEAPIVAPTRLTATKTPNGDVQLRWAQSSHPNLRGYNVYRLMVGQLGISKINSAEIIDNEYLDTSANPDLSSEYWVTAISTKGNESGLSISFELGAHTSPGVKDEDFDE